MADSWSIVRWNVLPVSTARISAHSRGKALATRAELIATWSTGADYVHRQHRDGGVLTGTPGSVWHAVLTNAESAAVHARYGYLINRRFATITEGADRASAILTTHPGPRGGHRHKRFKGTNAVADAMEYLARYVKRTLRTVEYDRACEFVSKYLYPLHY